jgi:RHS repeat-associated protein
MFNSEKLVSVKYPNNAQRNYQYDSDGLLIGVSDERGFSTLYSYNQYNRLTKTTRADGSEIFHDDVVSKTISNGYANGSNGQLKKIGLENGQVFDGIIDARGAETKFEKDLNGFVTKILDGNGDTTEITRNIAGQSTQIKRTDGSFVSFSYDNITHDMQSVSDSLAGRTQTFQYDDYGNILSEGDSTGRSSIAKYDNRGLLMERESSDGIKFNYFYNNFGQTTQISAPVSSNEVFTRSFNYDDRQNMISEIDSNGSASSYLYDLAGNVLSATKKRDDFTILNSQLSYDVFNRLVSVTNLKNQTTEYIYSATGVLQIIKNNLNTTLTYELDALGRAIKKTEFDGGVTEYAYDVNDNLISVKDPKGVIRQLEYDQLNRLIRKVLPDNLFEYSYDVRGHIVASRDKNSEITFNIDALGKVLNTTTRGINGYTYPVATINYNYNTAGRVSSVVDSYGGINAYEYDVRHELSRITTASNHAVTFNYDDRQRITSFSRPGIITNISYNGSALPTNISHSSSGAVFAFENYSRNDAGQVTSMQDYYGVTNYQYDLDSYLVNATHPAASHPSLQNEAFNYDEIGNRIGDGSIYNVNKQFLNEDSKYIYIYDANGNLQSKQNKITSEVIKYDYTSENQLIGVKYYSNFLSSFPAKEISYIYSPAGQRLEKKVFDYVAIGDNRKTYTRRYVYEGQKILLELDGDNNLLARYVNGFSRNDDVLGVEITPTGTSYGLAPISGFYSLLHDQLGTVKQIVNENGVVQQNYIYSAFGQLLKTTDAVGNDITETPLLSLPFGFTGRELDKESGLYYYRARYYDPEIGRFIQKDTDPGVITVPKTVVNKYSYVANNPINLSDPQGLGFIKDFFSGRMFAENPLLHSLTVAVVAGAIIYFSGGTLAGAAAAIGATAAGSATAAAALAAFQGGNFWDNFNHNFAGFFTVSALFLAGSAVLGGGVVEAGANSAFQGYVQTNNAGLFGYSGGVTIGSGSALYQTAPGASTQYAGVTYAAHELGHTIQFIMLAPLTANSSDPVTSTWLIYLGLGYLGSPYGPAWGNFWEYSANSVGF